MGAERDYGQVPPEIAYAIEPFCRESEIRKVTDKFVYLFFKQIPYPVILL